MQFFIFANRDGRFRLGDEIINVNGKSLRGLTMEEAKSLLKTCGPDVDIILARDPDQQIQAESQTNATTSAATAGKVIERFFLGLLNLLLIVFTFTKSFLSRQTNPELLVFIIYKQCTDFAHL